MNSKIIRLLLIIYLAVFSISAWANRYPSTSSTVDQVYYGVVDGIDGRESKIVIDDTSLKYDNITKFENSRGVVQVDIWDTVEPGDYVEYHVIPSSNQLLLIDLKVLSVQEFLHAIEQEYE